MSNPAPVKQETILFLNGSTTVLSWWPIRLSGRPLCLLLFRKKKSLLLLHVKINTDTENHSEEKTNNCLISSAKNHHASNQVDQGRKVKNPEEKERCLCSPKSLPTPCFLWLQFWAQPFRILVCHPVEALCWHDRRWHWHRLNSKRKIISHTTKCWSGRNFSKF